MLLNGDIITSLTVSLAGRVMTVVEMGISVVERGVSAVVGKIMSQLGV